MPLTRTQVVDRAAEYASSVLASEGQLRPIIIMAIGAAWDAQPSTGDSIRLGKGILVNGFCELRKPNPAPRQWRDQTYKR